MMLSLGQVAPSFEAPDQSGVIHSLSEYAGKWLVLYFYPKDDTPGCTTEACQIRDSFNELQAKAAVVGVSGDTAASHAKFATKYELPFTLLADPDKEVLEAYGTTGALLPKRATFIIDPTGHIAKIYEKVTPNGHAAQLLADLGALGA